jgi:hypothetical protein
MNKTPLKIQTGQNRKLEIKLEKKLLKIEIRY